MPDKVPAITLPDDTVSLFIMLINPFSIKHVDGAPLFYVFRKGVTIIGEISEYNRRVQEIKKLKDSTNLEKELSKLKKQIRIVENLIKIENED